MKRPKEWAIRQGPEACPVCGKAFYKQSQTQRYCSVRCRLKVQYAKEIEIKASVEVQGTVFKEGPKMIEGRESWKREHDIGDGGEEDESE